MKQLVYVPEECGEKTVYEVDKDGNETEEVKEILPPKFEGSVTLALPNYIQRMGYIKQCNFKTEKDAKGNVEVVAGMENIDSIIEMAKIAEKHVKKVDLKNLETGDVYSEWAELLDDPDCDGVIQDVSGVVINGRSLGKN